MEEIASRTAADAGAERTCPGTARLMALLETFQARLGASNSATETLHRHCLDHGIATDPVITARRRAGREVPAGAGQRARLQLADGETARYRRVHLMCGAIGLCDAEIWYVPSRLPDEVNHALEHGDIPFGRLIAPLGPRRETLASRILRPGARALSGDEAGWKHLLAHRALVLDRHGVPLAEVHELYTRTLFPQSA